MQPRLTRLLASLLPFNTLRKIAYRICRGVKIGKKSRIGWLCVLDADVVDIGDFVSIGCFNLVTDVKLFKVGEHGIDPSKEKGGRSGLLRGGVKIGSFNIIKGGGEIVIGKNVRMGNFNSIRGRYDENLGELCEVTDRHYFDTSRDIYIGRACVIGGVDSSFWTHGADRKPAPIFIGDHVWIGAGCKFNMGVRIGPVTLVGMGSVVTKSFEKGNLFIAGNPAKVVKENYDWRRADWS